MKRKSLTILLIILCFVAIAFSQPEKSSWDGTAYCIKDYLKVNLHDPQSLKIQDTYEFMQAGEDYLQRISYRAKNAFGAYIYTDKVFFMEKVYGKRRKYEVYSVLDYSTFKAYLNK